MNEANEAIVSKRRMRWWMPAGIVGLAGATIAYLQDVSDVEGPLCNMYSVMTGELSVLLLVVWFIFFTGLRWRTRLVAALGIIGAAGGLGFILARTVRMDGSISGAGMPKLTWRWTPKPDAGMRKLEVAATDLDLVAVDLATTSDRDFPQFLGHERLGVIRGVRIARDWTIEPPRELWRQPVGVGWSSFAIVGSWAVTQEHNRGEGCSCSPDRKPRGRIPPRGSSAWKEVGRPGERIVSARGLWIPPIRVVCCQLPIRKRFDSPSERQVHRVPRTWPVFFGSVLLRITKMR